MASLSEMLQYADYASKNNQENSGAGKIASLAHSFLGGMQYAAQQKTAALDRATKLLDLQKTQNEMETAAQNRKIQENFAKSLGLLPPTPDESANARGVAFDALGTTPTGPKDMTGGGKLAATFKTAAENPYNIPKAHFSSKEGLSFTMEQDPSKERAPKDPAADQGRIRQLAEEAARREKFNMIAATVGPEEAAKYANVQPTEDEVQKYIPEITAFQKGQDASAKDLMAKRKAALAPTGAVLESIQGLDKTSLLDKAQNAASSVTRGLINPATVNPFEGIDPETVAQYKTKILSGATVEDILGDISGKIKKLAIDPAKNREALKDLVRQKVSLMSIGGK